MRPRTGNRPKNHCVSGEAALSKSVLISPFLSALALLSLAVCVLGVAETAVAGAAVPAFSVARWIAPPEGTFTNGPLPLIRKDFTVDEAPRKATLRVIGLGDYDPRVNGTRLAETGMNQPWSQYEETLYYRDYDITELVQPGENAVGIMLFNSFWDNHAPGDDRYYKIGPQRTAEEPLLLIAEIILESKDGTIQRIGSDESWRITPGPIVFSHIFAGEDYDARRELPGWDAPGFDDSAWSTVRVAEAPASELLPQHWPPIAEIKRYQPAVIDVERGVDAVFEFPQNTAAQVHTRITGGEPGSVIRFKGGEHVKDGRLHGHYIVWWEVTTDGNPIDHRWLSFYLGMQFVEVTGAAPAGHPNPQGLPVLESMELVQVRTGMDEVGSFTSSSEVYNGTHHIIDQAMQANAHHVMTDCPHREKLGWLEQTYLMARSFQYRYDTAAWFNKILRDIRDAQLPSGRVLTVAPSYPTFREGFHYTVEWGAAAVILPWRQYEWTGDLHVLRDNLDMMRQFTADVGNEARDGLAPAGLGDWYDYGHGNPPGPSHFTPQNLSATATWALCARILEKTTAALGLHAESAEYRALHAQIAADFQRHFRNPETGKIQHNGSPQAGTAMALYADLVPEEDRAMLVEEIIADLEARDGQQTPGDIGHVYFIRILAAAGHSDILHRVYAREGTGSYGGILAKGLTAMPETWDAIMDGRQSLNHCMLGHVMEWFYGYVAGIRQAPGSIGWKEVLIAPNPGDLTHAEAAVMTPSGKITSRWKREDGRFTLHTEIPAGVSATAILPSGQQRTLSPGTHRIVDPISANEAPHQ